MSTKKFIRIVGDTAEIVTERVERKVALNDLLGEVVKDMGLITPILPKGCRLCTQKGSKTIFVIEEEPKVRSLSWTNMGENPKGGKWKLAFPFILWVIVFDGSAVSSETKIFYRTSPLGSGDDKLKKVNLCNVDGASKICTGSMRVVGETLAQKAESYIQQFWGVGFNSDYADYNFNPTANRVGEVKKLASWQEASESNSLFPLSANWLDAGKLSDYIQL